MHYRGEKIWHHFAQDIIAPGSKEARYLTWFLQWARTSRTYLRCLEVVDLQQYRLITRRSKIQDIIFSDPAEQFFRFVVNKN